MLPMQELFFSSWVGWSTTLSLTDVFIFVKEKKAQLSEEREEHYFSLRERKKNLPIYLQ